MFMGVPRFSSWRRSGRRIVGNCAGHQKLQIFRSWRAQIMGLAKEMRVTGKRALQRAASLYAGWFAAVLRGRKKGKRHCIGDLSPSPPRRRVRPPGLPSDGLLRWAACLACRPWQRNPANKEASRELGAVAISVGSL